MLNWLKQLAAGKEGTPSEATDVKPLSFSYLNARDDRSDVLLLNWVEDGVYVHGENLMLGRRMTYRLDRIERFKDLSYKQLKGFRPPAGSPLDPRRLP